MPKTNKEHTRPSRRPKPKNNRKPDTRLDEKLDSKGRDNDPNWYFTSPELASQAAELSFQSYLGTGPVISNYSVPDIMVFKMNPCPGCSYQVTGAANSMPTDAQVKTNGNVSNLTPSQITETKDGINLMSTKLYTLLSTYSGRTSSYGPQDIAIMYLAIGELMSTVEHIRRAFGVAMTYNPRNRMLPLGLLKAMGIDGQDLIANLANYRMRFNVAIARINQIPILDNIGYLRKCRELYQKVYVDDVSSMAQLYMYVPNSTWILHEEAILSTWTHGSWLNTESIAALTNMSQLLTLLESMINALLFSSTYNIVYADLINLANKTSVQFTSFDYLAENYVVMPEFNRNANLQMHNLTIWQDANQPGQGQNQQQLLPYNLSTAIGPNFYFTPFNNVYADARVNAVLYNPVFPVLYTEMNTQGSGAAWYTGPIIVDMDTDNPTLEDRIEALRFKVAESGYFVTQDQITRDRFYKIVPALPDHYCISAVIWDTDNSNTTIPSTVRDSAVFPFSGGKITQLKNAPIMLNKANSTYCDNTVQTVYGDLTFFTTIDFNYLYRLNRLIATGLFDFR